MRRECGSHEVREGGVGTVFQVGRGGERSKGAIFRGESLTESFCK